MDQIENKEAKQLIRLENRIDTIKWNGLMEENMKEELMKVEL